MIDRIRCGCKSCSIVLFISLCILGAVGVSAGFLLLIRQPILVILTLAGTVALASIFDITTTSCSNPNTIVKLNDRRRGIRRKI